MRAADLRCREKGGMISLFLNGHGNTLLRTLREINGKGFAARYPETAKLSEVMLQLNETSLINSAAITRRTTWNKTAQASK